MQLEAVAISSSRNPRIPFRVIVTDDFRFLKFQITTNAPLTLHHYKTPIPLSARDHPRREPEL